LLLRADGLGGVEIEPAGEDRQSPEQYLFGIGEQCVRPVHGRAQGLLAAYRGCVRRR